MTIVGTKGSGVTDLLGQFRIDSVVPGEYKLQLSHPLLDSIGIAIETQPIAMPLARYAVVRLSTPSQSTVLNLFCPAGQAPDGTVGGDRTRAGRRYGCTRDRCSRRAVLDRARSKCSHGCAPRTARPRGDGGLERFVSFLRGTPASVQGSVRASRGGLATADVPITTQGELVSIAMLHVPSPDTVVTASAPTPAAGAPAPPKPAVPVLRTGRAVVHGRATDPSGKPIARAEVVRGGGSGYDDDR